jgi:GntR family transcriptional regulator/MocR family aminotransferase
MQIPLLLDRSQPETLTDQLADQLRVTIRQSRLAPGARLPSSRRLAEQLGISRNTVVRAYDILSIEGYVAARPASGLFVCNELPDVVPRPQEQAASAVGDNARAMPRPRFTPEAPDLVNQNRSRLTFDYFPGRPNAGLFPLKTWRRLIQNALSHGGALGLSQYSDPAGLMSLRTAIADHLAAARGIVAEPSRVIIVSGIQEGINIAARLFLHPGAAAALECPCYQGAAYAFRATGAEIRPVAVDGTGLIPDDLPVTPAALLYLTPSHQYPIGGTLTLDRRNEVIAWARRHGCYILEDDYDGDFRYEGSPLPAITALAPDCSIYLGTFSKALGAGLRLGYMVVPSSLAAAVRSAKGLLNNGNPWLDQSALAEMMRSGSYVAHVTRIRAVYKENRDRLIAALRRHFGDVDISGGAAGLHVFWMLPDGVPDAERLEIIARRARVGVYSMTTGGAYDARSTAWSRRGTILGFAGMQPGQVEQGIAKLSQAVDDALEEHGPSFGHDEAPQPEHVHPVTIAHLAPQTRQRPALRSGRRPRALSRWRHIRESGTPMPIISGLYRYPIKGLSAQIVSSETLESGQPFPHDRIFALARAGSAADIDEPKWTKKGLFVMLMLEEGLARVQTRLDVATLELTISQGNDELLRANLDDELGRRRTEEFFHRLVPTLRAAPRLVRSRTGHFMDKPDNVLSLINVATVRALEEQWGYEIDPLRFRANIYIEGARPWEEFDWIGRDIVVGDTLMRIDRRNGRCGATNVNPATGRRDLDIPGSLRAAFGHKDLGIYLVVREGGKLAIGDTVIAPRAAESGLAAVAATGAARGGRRFMCRGCYYIYDEGAGLPDQAIPPGTHFAEISASWVCPDCGSDKATFRPHLETRR